MLKLRLSELTYWKQPGYWVQLTLSPEGLQSTTSSLLTSPAFEWHFRDPVRGIPLALAFGVPALC